MFANGVSHRAAHRAFGVRGPIGGTCRGNYGAPCLRAGTPSNDPPGRWLLEEERVLIAGICTEAKLSIAPKVPCMQWMILGDGPFLVSQWITIPSLDDRLRDLAEVLQHKGPHEAPLKELTLGIKLLQ
jgi:hypothetical protein